MPLIKIEHADPKSARPVAFDVMGVINQDETNGNQPPKTTGEPGLENLEVKSTFVLNRMGEFHLMDLSGGEVLHSVSEEALMERTEALRKEVEEEETKAREAAEIARAANPPVRANDLGNPNDAPGTGTGNHPPSIADTSANNPRTVPDLTPRPQSEAESAAQSDTSDAADKEEADKGKREAARAKKAEIDDAEARGAHRKAAAASHAKKK